MILPAIVLAAALAASAWAVHWSGKPATHTTPPPPVDGPARVARDLAVAVVLLAVGGVVTYASVVTA